MTTESQEQLDLQLKNLEREKRLEEIKQLKASGTIRWITPTALAALLPLLAGFGIWIHGEIKEYSEGYRALRERDKLQEEKEALQKQKDSLHVEISTLLQLKEHYAEQAKRFSQEAQAKQDVMDKTYLQGVFATSEAIYSLDHVKGMGPGPDRKVMNDLREELKKLPRETVEKMDDILRRYELSVTIITITRDLVSEFEKTLKLIPASEWTHDLQAMPSGSVIQGRSIMFSKNPRGRRYYDVMEGRFLTKEEAKDAK